MSPCERYEVDAWHDTNVVSRSDPRVPMHLHPARDEAFLSWIWRLATRMQVPMCTLASTLTDLPIAPIDPFWSRPNVFSLQRIAMRTGIRPEHLQAMTFNALTPIRGDDEINDRFCGPRVTRASRRRLLSDRIVVCPPCLLEGSYLRRDWMLGWYGVCPTHGSVLLTHCPQCGAGLTRPSMQAGAPRPLHQCGCCRADFAHATPEVAHPAAVRFQEALLEGKHRGELDLGPFGTLDWSIAIALIDVLLTLMRVGPTSFAQERFLARIAAHYEVPFDPRRHWRGRYGSLLTLAWLLSQWPLTHRGFSFLRRSCLYRLITRSSDLSEPMRASLLATTQAADARFATARWAGRRWLAQLSESAQELRFRAFYERHRYRRRRLLALAELRAGRCLRDAAAIIGVTPITVDRWLSAGARGGLDAALTPRIGRSRLSRRQATLIDAWLKSRPAPEDAKFRVLRRSDIVQFARRQLGIEISAHTASRLLADHGQRPRQRRPRRKRAKVSTRFRNIVQGLGT